MLKIFGEKSEKQRQEYNKYINALVGEMAQFYEDLVDNTVQKYEMEAVLKHTIEVASVQYDMQILQSTNFQKIKKIQSKYENLFEKEDKITKKYNNLGKTTVFGGIVATLLAGYLKHQGLTQEYMTQPQNIFLLEQMANSVGIDNIEEFSTQLTLGLITDTSVISGYQTLMQSAQDFAFAGDTNTFAIGLLISMVLGITVCKIPSIHKKLIERSLAKLDYQSLIDGVSVAFLDAHLQDCKEHYSDIKKEMEWAKERKSPPLFVR